MCQNVTTFAQNVFYMDDNLHVNRTKSKVQQFTAEVVKNLKNHILMEWFSIFIKVAR